MGPQTQARVARDSWSTPQDLGPKREWPWSAGQTLGHRALARVNQDRRSTSRALGHEPELSGNAGRPRGPSNPSARKDVRQRGPSGTVPSNPGQLIGPAGHRTRAQIAWESWSTPRALGHGPKWPGTAGRRHGPWDIGRKGPGYLVDPARPRAQLDHNTSPQFWGRVTRDAKSTPWYDRPGPESPWKAGRPRGTSGTGPSPPAQLVERGPSEPVPGAWFSYWLGRRRKTCT